MKRKERIAELKASIEYLDEQIEGYRRGINTSRVMMKRYSGQLDQAKRDLERLCRPKEPEDGSVITFARNMDYKSYRYAAIRVGDRWYTTGSTCPRYGFTWDQLLGFISGKNGDTVKYYSNIIRLETGKIIELAR